MKNVIYALSDITTRPVADISKLVHYIAAEHSEIFMEAYDKIVLGKITWEEEARAFMRDHRGEKIQCIKKIRELSDLGLKEAKDWFEDNEFKV